VRLKTPAIFDGRNLYDSRPFVHRPGDRVLLDRKKSLKAPNTSKARVLVVGDVMLDRYWYGDAFAHLARGRRCRCCFFREEEYRLGGAAKRRRELRRAWGAATRLLFRDRRAATRPARHLAKPLARQAA